ncbi:hypothetical protein VDGD_21747 [Verticillium dahliae]|nr:hypothetical protein VDGD_21747 [Verticillium dahliae]
MMPGEMGKKNPELTPDGQHWQLAGLDAYPLGALLNPESSPPVDASLPLSLRLTDGAGDGDDDGRAGISKPPPSRSGN